MPIKLSPKTIKKEFIAKLEELSGQNIQQCFQCGTCTASSPESFIKRERDPEEMSYWQLKRYAKRVLTEGYDNTRYLVDMNFKIAFPFIILIMVLMGTPISLRVEKGGVAFAIFIGIGICFLYLVTLGLARSLGLSGILPPTLSAWLGNLIFLFLSIYLMMKVAR